MRKLVIGAIAEKSGYKFMIDKLSDSKCSGTSSIFRGFDRMEKSRDLNVIRGYIKRLGCFVVYFVFNMCVGSSEIYSETEFLMSLDIRRPIRNYDARITRRCGIFYLNKIKLVVQNIVLGGCRLNRVGDFLTSGLHSSLFIGSLRVSEKKFR